MANLDAKVLDACAKALADADGHTADTWEELPWASRLHYRLEAERIGVVVATAYEAKIMDKPNPWRETNATEVS